MEHKLFSHNGSLIDRPIAFIRDSEVDELIYYDEPLLWTYKNKAGDTIIIISNDENSKCARYFGFVVNPEVYKLMEDKVISIVGGMEQAKLICIIDTTQIDYDLEVAKYYKINFENIPENHLPGGDLP